MNAIGSADPLGRPRALTALVVTIVTRYRQELWMTG